MGSTTKKIAERVASALLDIAHEGTKQAVNKAASLIHEELGKRKEQTKRKVKRWAGN